MNDVVNMIDFMAREIKRKLSRARTQEEHKAALDAITDYNRIGDMHDTLDVKILDMDGNEI